MVTEFCATDTREQAAEPLRGDQSATPGGVNVVPDAMAAGDLAAALEVRSIMPALVVPAVATTMTGTSPHAPVRRDRLGQRG